MNATQLLSNLVATKSPPKAKEKTPSRPQKVLNEPESTTFATWAAAAVAGDVLEARQECEHAWLKELFLAEFTEHLWNQGFRPINPKVVTLTEGNDLGGVAGNVDHQANYTVQEKFKLHAKTSGELKDALHEVLGDDKLFETEIDCTPLTTLRPFNELVIGHYVGKDFIAATQAEQDVAVKLLTFVQGKNAKPLTDAERELVLINQDQMKVQPGFFDRVKGYCKDVDQLRLVFKVIEPVHFLSHAKFAVSDNPQDAHDRLLQWVDGILGADDETD